MSNIGKNKIIAVIKALTLGYQSDHVTHLLLNCVGRVCVNDARRGEDWWNNLQSLDLKHIVDWLVVAVANDEPWLKDVDSKGRPKKLMKFGNLQDVAREADKAMLKEIQRIDSVELIEGDEELFMELDDGYRLVRLLTPSALDREGKEMQHCIGGGAYDDDLKYDDHLFLSLRDKNNKAHATLEIADGALGQFQGKQNKTPSRQYADAIKPFFSKTKYTSELPIKDLGYVVDAEGDSYDLEEIDRLPAGVTFNGNLNLGRTDVSTLPENMTVYGSLYLQYTNITQMPEGLRVGGSIYLNNTSVDRFSDNVKIGGGLNLNDSCITYLPEELYVPGTLSLMNTPIQCLPDGLKVGMDLHFVGSAITRLPKRLTVVGVLHIAGTLVTELAEGLTVKGGVNLRRTSITSLPDSLSDETVLWTDSGRITARSFRELHLSTNVIPKNQTR